MKKTPIQRNKSLARRRSRQIGAGTPQQRERFHQITIARANGDCPITDDGNHDGPLEAHHVVAQSKLRNYAVGRLTDDEADELLWDPDNGLAICRRHHERHTLATRRIPVYALELRHVAFAAAVNMAWYIANYYREGETDAA